MLRCAAPSPPPRCDAASRASRYSTAIIRRPPPTTPNPTRLPIPPQDALVARCLRLDGEDGEDEEEDAPEPSVRSSGMRAMRSGLHTMRKKTGTDSTAAQARAVKGSWVELKSTSPFVSMSMKYTAEEGSKSRYARKSHALTHLFVCPPPPSTR